MSGEGGLIAKHRERIQSSQGSTDPEPPPFVFSQSVAQDAIVQVILFNLLPLEIACNEAFAGAINRVYNPSLRALSPYLFKYDHHVAIEEFAKLACYLCLPLDFADSDVFEKYFRRALNPEARRISQKELYTGIVKLVKASKSVLINDFANFPNKVSICADIWSNDGVDYCYGENRYVGITCHWIDDKWILQKRLIAFKLFDCEESAKNISGVIDFVLKKYGLVTKVASLSLDNDTANKADFKSLANACEPSIRASFFHVRCMSSVLNACVQDALNALKDEVGPITKAIASILDHTPRTKKWVRFCYRKDFTPKILRPDEANCWDTTYRMLSESYEYRDALCLFFAKKRWGIELSASHWDACSNLSLLLKTFKEVILELSRVYYPTSVLVVDNCVKVAVMFNSLVGCDGLGACIDEMMVKWLKDFQEIPDVFLIAKLLDPRMRLDGLEELLGFYYDALFPVKDENTPVPSVVAGKAKQCLYDIFLEYKSKFRSDSEEGMDVAACSSDFEKTLSIRLQSFYDKRKPGKRPRRDGSNPYEELESYFTSDFEYLEAESFDILKWWSRMGMSFPVLSLIAKDVLAVPASTATIDQAFGDENGYVLDCYQSTLSPWVVERYRLLGDWVKADERKQEIVLDEESDEDDIDEYNEGDTDDDTNSDNDGDGDGDGGGGDGGGDGGGGGGDI